MEKRLNIGFLIDDPNNYFTSQACKGAELAAKALDANLFIFPGHYIGKPDGRYTDTEYEYQYNILFDLPNRHNVDILYVLMGTIGSRADKDLQKNFVDKLPRVPIVTLFADIEGYPSVTFDNGAGITQLLKHLIDKHGAKRIGYVSGPGTNKDAAERLSVFRSYLTERGMPPEDCQIVFGDFTDESQDTVTELLEKNEHLDAIIFANDNMAVGGYEVLKKRGLIPGKDILVAGFDNDVFAASMLPPLTTVEASSADLTYRAVLAANDFIQNTHKDSLEVKPYLIQRSSCGCDESNDIEIREYLHLEGIVSGDRSYVDSIRKYLFGFYADNEHIALIKSYVEAFCISCSRFFINGKNRSRVDRTFRNMVDADVLSYVSTEKFYMVLRLLQKEGLKICKGLENEAAIYDMFSEYYRLLSIKSLNLLNNYIEKEDKVARLVNTQMGDIFIMSHEGNIPYELLLEGLDTVGFKQSFLYFFQGKQKHCKGEKWKCPKSVLLTACSGKDGIKSPSEELQLIRTEKIFLNEFVNSARRLTMMVFPLFVGEHLYGLLVNELNISDIANVSMVAYQLSVSVRSLMMIEEQNQAKKELQDSLERFIRDNSLLTREAKSDELTGLYNRRGFLEYTQKAITDVFNQGRYAIVAFADMDDLKQINDTYGHDEGDYAIRQIGLMLNDAFRNTDILARIGGDEFVVFALVDVPDYESTIKERLKSIIDRYNQDSNKPYRIDMSIGIHEFICSKDSDIYELLELADDKLYIEKDEKKRAD